MKRGLADPIGFHLRSFFNHSAQALRHLWINSSIVGFCGCCNNKGFILVGSFAFAKQRRTFLRMLLGEFGNVS